MPVGHFEEIRTSISISIQLHRGNLFRISLIVISIALRYLSGVYSDHSQRGRPVYALLYRWVN